MERTVYINSYSSPEIDKNDVLRYAKGEGDKTTLDLLDECISEAEGVFTYNVCFSRYAISLFGDEVDLGFCKVNSHSLALCLRDCSEIVVFGATVGSGIDRLIGRYSILSPSRAIIFQALGSERVEALCDVFCNELAEREFVRPRFSPGYGDLPLELQRNIFDSLDLTRKLGINLNENLFMTPTKSVTAIVGIIKG
jgi:hypothetical protein